MVDSVDPDLLARARNGGGAAEAALPRAPRAAGGDGASPLSAHPGRVLVKVDPRYHRPTEVASLIGDAAKARERLGWRPEIGFEQLVHEMVWEDLDQARRDELARAGGFRVHKYRE